jgi:hypothetical protein
VINASTALLGPLSILFLVAVTDAWVFVDARRRGLDGRPVVAEFGSLVLETPTTWLVACGLLWVLFFPAYLVARANSSPGR